MVGQFAIPDGVVDLHAREIRRAGGPAPLTPIEHALLAYLAARPGQAVAPDTLLTEVWGYATRVRSRTVATTVQRLRRKLERDPSAPEVLVTRDRCYALVLTGGASELGLPAEGTPLVGRSAEVAALEALLARGGLVSVVGPGGMGKTRLAAAVARRLAAGGARVAWVDARPLADAASLLSAVATALGDPTGDPGAAAVALASAPAVLVLDDVDGVVGARDALVALGDAAPEAPVLVTARAPVGLLAEAVVPLGGLAYPADGDDTAVAASEAGRLFGSTVARVAGAPPDDPVAVAAVVRLVDGMPLALILAATWARLLDAAAIAAALSDGIDVLRADLADVPPRHRSVEAALLGSWTALAAADRSTLARLSVFRQPFTVAAATTVGPLDAVRRLADRGLVRRWGARLSLHPVVGAFAAARLAEVPGWVAEAEAAHDRCFGERAALGWAVCRAQTGIDVAATAGRAEAVELDAVRERALARGALDTVWGLFFVAYAAAEDRPPGMLGWLARATAGLGAGPDAAVLRAVFAARAAMARSFAGADVRTVRADLAAAEAAVDAVGAHPRQDLARAVVVAQRAQHAALFADDGEGAIRDGERAALAARRCGALWFEGIARGAAVMGAALTGQGDRIAEHDLPESALGGPGGGAGRHAATVGLALATVGRLDEAAARLGRARVLLSGEPPGGFLLLALGWEVHVLSALGRSDEARAIATATLPRLVDAPFKPDPVFISAVLLLLGAVEPRPEHLPVVAACWALLADVPSGLLRRAVEPVRARLVAERGPAWGQPAPPDGDARVLRDLLAALDAAS